MNTNTKELEPTDDEDAINTSVEHDNIKFSKEFHVKEWESLRDEITVQIEHTRKLELATVVGLGAFYAWYFSVNALSPPRFLLIIPSLLVLLAGLRAWGTLVRIKQIARYIRAIEERFCLGGGELIGWDRMRDKYFKKSSPFKISAALFWFASLVVSILAWEYL